MILTCNSCGKKFVVPDNAVTSSGRVVQCGSCGNKWKQYPINEEKQTQPVFNIKKTVAKTKRIQSKIQKSIKTKKNSVRKPREIDLYSPEYLAKKHGITLSNGDTKNFSSEGKISFGFFNWLIIFLLIIIVLSRGMYFFQDFVIQKLPFIESYLNYYFESVRNLFEIWKSLISSY
tara:strand:+ start:88 stop:612 length:525 start_codon:yes stop_codon:yes gene_type:complete